MLYSALWSTANWMPAITSRTVALPSSSETLIETRFASGRDAHEAALVGVAVVAALRESPAMMPATCVPWP